MVQLVWNFHFVLAAFGLRQLVKQREYIGISPTRPRTVEVMGVVVGSCLVFVAQTSFWR